MRQAYVYTALAVLFWTTGPVGSKAALNAARNGDHLTPLQVAFYAIAVGWLFLFAALLLRRRLGRLRDISGRGWLILIATGLFGWVGYPLASNFAYTRLPLPDALVISYLNPVFVTLFQGALFGSVVRLIAGWEQEPDQRARRAVANITVGLALCLVGVAVIATEGRLLALGAVRSAEGVVAALFAGFAWGVYSNLGRFVRMRAGADPRGLGDVQNFAAMAVALAVMGAGLGLSGQLGSPLGYHTAFFLGKMGPTSVEACGVLAVMGLLNYCAGYPLWFRALELGAHAGQAHKLPPLTYLVLVLAVLLGWLVLHESFGEGFWQGTALIAAGNAVCLSPGWRRRPTRGDAPR